MQKVSERRVLIKVPISLRDRIKKKAKEYNKTMIGYLDSLVP